MTRSQDALSDRNGPALRTNIDMRPDFGRILATYPEQNAVDVAMRLGGVLRKVPVLRPIAGTFEGTTYLPEIKNPDTVEKTPLGLFGDLRGSAIKDTFAVVGFMGGDIKRPVIMGFLPPEQYSGSFPDASGEVSRHRNGIYTRYGDDGFEMSHPSGTFIKMGTSATKTSLNSTNVDSKQPFKDTDGVSAAAPDLVISHSSGLNIHITTSGSIIITKAGGGSFVLETHTHSGVAAGAGSTGGPQ